MSQSTNYNDSNLRSIDGLEWIFNNPDNHIRTADSYGQFHIIKELLDNAIDETEEDSCPGNRTTLYLFLDNHQQTYTAVIKDNGRGIPIDSLERTFTRLFTSAKYKGEDDVASIYKASAGLNGIGSKVALTLSENFKAISVRDNKVGIFTANRYEVKTGVNVTQNEVIDYNSHVTGTIVAYEPRKGYFTEVDSFLQEGYLRLLNLCYIISMFSHKTHLTVKLIPRNIDSVFWTLDPIHSVDFIENTYQEEFVILLDGKDEYKTMQYLANEWLLEDSHFTWRLENISRDLVERIGYRINLYLPKILRGTNATAIVNNVPLKDNSSSNITGLLEVVKERLSGFLQGKDKHLVEYFNNIYKLPICIATSLKYTDVKFTSLSKDGFKNKTFENEYKVLLNKDFDNVNPQVFADLYNLIERDIENKYLMYYNKPLTSKKDRKNLSTELGEKYYTCNTKNRSEAELYIVEGLSASHITTVRDPHTQAVLCLYGKPKNVVRDNEGYSSEHFNTYKPYKSLSELLNISGNFFDEEQIQFGKIIILNDADIDGSHIRSLHIANLSILNEKILSTGMIYLANPPLYEVTIGRNGTRYFIQDKKEFIRFCADMLYRTVFDLAVGSDIKNIKPELLTPNQYVDFCEIVISIGEIVDNLSMRLAIPPIIIEKLTKCTSYIERGNVNIDELIKIFGVYTRYDPLTHVLYISDSEEDVVFSLDGVADAIREELLPILHKIRWKELSIYITTKMCDLYKDCRISLVMLYKHFIQLQHDTLVVTRQKGLGGMDAEDLAVLCLNKQTRVLHQITSIGDLERIYNLMGDDSTARKQILMDKNLL